MAALQPTRSAKIALIESTQLVKVLVTGASGLLGATLVQTALDHGFDITAAYHNHPTKFECENIALSLTDRNRVESIIQHYQPDWIVHCAASTNVDWCESNPGECWATNVEATKVLAGACNAAGMKLLYVSTDSVFDGRRGSYAEEDAVGPLNEYSKSKLAGEEAAHGTLKHALIVRATIYGWNLQNKECFAEAVVHRMAAGESMPGFVDAVFSPLYVGDLSRIMLDAVRRGFFGTYHIGSSDTTSKYEFARNIARTFGYDPIGVRPTKLAEARLKAQRPLNVSLQVSKITHELYEMPSVQDGIDAFYRTYNSGGVANLKSKGIPEL